MKKRGNLKINSAIIIIGIIGCFAIVANFNNLDSNNLNPNSLTGQVTATAGDSCTTANSQACDGTSVLLCINGKWEDVGEIPGQCNYQTEDENLPIGDDTTPDEQGNSNMWMVAIILLVIAILAIVAFLVYRMMIKNKPNNKSNQTLVKKPAPGSPSSPRPGISSALRPIPFVTPTTNSPMVRSSAPISSNITTASTGVKRYVPPVR